MACRIEYTDEFGAWWDTLSEAEQEAIAAHVKLLEERGTGLPFPYSSTVRGSRHGHMRELRVRYRRRAIRILYAFNPLRTAILLIGGSKKGDDRWYAAYVPIADRLYDVHLRELKEEGLLA